MPDRALVAQSHRADTEFTDGSTLPGPLCNRCGFPVVIRPRGCKNPCTNCGTVYPLGDCSD